MIAYFDQNCDHLVTRKIVIEDFRRVKQVIIIFDIIIGRNHDFGRNTNFETTIRSIITTQKSNQKFLPKNEMKNLDPKILLKS